MRDIRAERDIVFEAIEAGSPPDTAWAEEATAEEEAVAGEAEPARKAWPRLDAPEAAVEGEVFEVVVGLRPDQDPGVVGDPVILPPDQPEPYGLGIHLVADGFRLAEADASWRQTLTVAADAPHPTHTYRLVAEEGTAPVRAEKLVVYFAVEGQTIGRAVRALAVVRSATLLSEAPPLPEPPGAHIAAPVRPEAVDLEVRIEYAEQRHRLRWTFESRHPECTLPDEPLSTDIGTDPEAFAQALIREVEGQADAAGFRLQLRGIGRTIRDELPTRFWDLLQTVAEHADQKRGAARPTVLLLSQEPHVPWELALCTERYDDEAPPYLGFQAHVGRWAFDPDRPDVDPPRDRAVTHLAAITGTYDHPKWSDLAEAKAEADALQAAYGAVAVTADFPSVVTLCMDGQPPADVIHFAVHGKYAPDQPGRGLVLVDGDNVRYLNDFAVRGFDLGKRPFVFLNACQVGSGNELLGNYAGLAQSFLAAGAAAVIAPLWSVSDRVAREFALAFYEAVAAGTPAAEAFRRARLGRVADASADASALDVATPFAYQFFGHPELTLDWQAAAA